MARCAGDTGVPREILKLAKARGCPGFEGHYIDWDKAGPWVEKQRSELEALIGTSMDDLRKIKLKEDIENVKLQNQKLKRMYLDPEDVRNFLTSMAVAQSALLKKMPKELAPRCVGKNVGEIEQMIEAGVIEIFQLFKDSIVKFMEKKD